MTCMSVAILAKVILRSPSPGFTFTTCGLPYISGATMATRGDICNTLLILSLLSQSYSRRNKLKRRSIQARKATSKNLELV